MSTNSEYVQELIQIKGLKKTWKLFWKYLSILLEHTRNEKSESQWTC